MAQILFTFTLNTDTGEAAFAGNVEIGVALQMLQQLTFAETIRQTKEQAQKELLLELEAIKDDP